MAEPTSAAPDFGIALETIVREGRPALSIKQGRVSRDHSVIEASAKEIACARFLYLSFMTAALYICKAKRAGTTRLWHDEIRPPRRQLRLALLSVHKGVTIGQPIAICVR